ncbi:MAG TPA: cytochrome P450 [Acidimicrobiales bacterium]|nr:cytochrome P450 [Acidimicrobiales bacterium]
MTVDDRFGESFEAQLRGDDASAPQPTFAEHIEGPVADFATDWSHLEPEYAQHMYEVLDDLRGRCPVAHTDRFGGGWLPVRYADVSTIAYDTDHFTSRSVVLSDARPPHEIAPMGEAPPISSDPPFHHDARRLLLPAFTKAKVEKLEPGTRAFCHQLIDGFAGRDVVDAAQDYAQYIPMRVIADMLGFPPGDSAIFKKHVETVLEGAGKPLEDRQAGFDELFQYLLAQIRDHVADPRDDLTSYLLDAEIYGMKLEPFHVAGTMALLLIAGIDTTWSAIGSSLWHLAKTPADRQRLVADRELLPTAMEEFLRAYAPVTMARLVKEEVEVGGVTMQPEDWVLLSFPAANRDPEQFERADEVVIDREINRHAAFGLGIHRCIGSHLARMELRVALEVWLERIPEFSLASDDPDHVRWAPGQVRGPRTLPIAIA